MTALANARMGGTCTAPEWPCGPCPVCPRLDRDFEPYRQAAFWKTQHERAKVRLARKNELIARQAARIRYLEQQLYGRSSESSATMLSSSNSEAATSTPPDPSPRCPRGQQRGQRGHGRRDHTQLPVAEEIRDLPEAAQCCANCGLPFVPFPGTQDSEVLEIEVRAHRRRIGRRRYRPTCQCGCNPGIVTASPEPRLIPRSILGISIWLEVLLDKYLFYRPTYRLLAEWRTLGLDLPLGTITDGLQKLVPLFEPLYEALIEQSRRQTFWHADETRWQVFATVEGKVGYRWYLWVFHSRQTVVFVLAMGRSHDVPEEHLGPDAQGILVVDRFVAYKVMQAVKDGTLVLAFCWAHQRRDFLEAARSWPALEDWALSWVERIGQLYAGNDRRLAVRQQPTAFAHADQQLRDQLRQMEQQAQLELADPQVHPTQKKVLESLGNHWTGLTVFVEHPEVPMDNNTAERVQRGPVVGRKNYYGSGAVWSGRLAAMLFSLFQTLCLWKINPRSWLQAYLQACAEAGGRPPTDWQRYLPWNCSADQREKWFWPEEQPPTPPVDTS
jgi:transposase